MPGTRDTFFCTIIFTKSYLISKNLDQKPRQIILNRKWKVSGTKKKEEHNSLLKQLKTNLSLEHILWLFFPLNDIRSRLARNLHLRPIIENLIESKNKLAAFNLSIRISHLMIRKSEHIWDLNRKAAWLFPNRFDVDFLHHIDERQITRWSIRRRSVIQILIDEIASSLKLIYELEKNRIGS